MAVEWTNEQKQIIGLRNRNILVAAAAGSGKTAVLVERILSMITDEDHPVDIDRLLVVTFTNAAAGQMKERIAKRLSGRLEEEPDDRNLKRQEDLLPHAKIMTIDSFCLYVVRNYFSSLDLDPDFRIGDEGELKLLREDVMKTLLERKYEEAAPEFFRFVESYAEGKGDGGIPEYIEKLYQFASAYPNPDRQLKQWKGQLEAGSAEAVRSAGWMECLMDEIHLEAEELAARYTAAREACLEPGGPYYYEDMFRSDEQIVKGLLSARTYEEAAEILSGLKTAFVRKPSKRDPAVDDEKKAFLSALRDEMKKALQDMAKQYYLGSMEQVLSDIRGCSGPLCELVDLAAEFGEDYSAAKREKNLVDFGDIEHFALEVLTEEGPDGKFFPTEAAVEMSRSFYEIMIDEYQDSNRIQEEILRSVSRERDGRPNIFMVGDVKQSIYKFRQARPELFMEKYEAYTVEDSLYQKIDLHRNFRSRVEVLSTVNFFFSQLMEKKLGGIAYDEDAALVPGRGFPKEPEEVEGESRKTEIIFLDSGKDRDKEADAKLAEYQAKELEAKAVAKRIRELTDPVSGYKVYDGQIGGCRTARYGDIVILLRTVTGWAEVFVDSLMEAGIPAYAQSRTGYFTAREVQCVLHLLRVIDNPMQDIPMAAVMKSPIGGFTSEELALITADFRADITPKETRGLYGAVKRCLEETRAEGQGGSYAMVSEELRGKVRRFYNMICDFRGKAVYMRLHQLLRYILEKTEYEYILAASPGGRLRLANIEMLIKRAVDYENTSYRGVFQFVRYIENLQKYSVDFGEASLAGEQEDTVRITSIHKSKGLEYPIVILAGAGKLFNQGDAKGKILLHPDLGIAADYIDTERRLKAATLPKKVFQRQLRLENLGEELRVLYVALTRAEEKLIITGTDRYLETKLTKWNSLRLEKGRELPYQEVSRASSYLDWMLMALVRSRIYGGVLSERGITPPVFHPVYGEEIPAAVHVESVETLVYHEVEKQASGELFKERLMDWDGLRDEDEKALSGRIADQLSYVYPYLAAVSAPRKFTVSQLKEIGMAEGEEEAVRLLENQDRDADRKRPAFLEKEEELSGAARGTAYHRVLELLPMTTEAKKESVEEAVRILEKQGLLPFGTGERLNLRKITRFLDSPLGHRMAEGERRGTLRKEQQFVMGMPAARIRPEYEEAGLSEERMLIQGIIDAWFEEDDGLVLVDYKTDKVDKMVGEAGVRRFLERYRTQVDYYQEALEQNTGKRVKERYLYSFSLERAIPL
nr:helicase-exonuclease AddAB subunit AddA [Lientehia hominis]